MGNYLANLIRRSLGRAEAIGPRPAGLFEPIPSTDGLAPEIDSGLEAPGNLSPDRPSSPLPLSSPGESPDVDDWDPSGLHRHRPSESSANPPWPPAVPRSPGMRPEQRRAPSPNTPVESKPFPTTERREENNESWEAESDPTGPGESGAEEPLHQSAATATGSEPSLIAVHKESSQSASDEFSTPALVPHGEVETLLRQDPSRSPDEAALQTGDPFDMIERSGPLKASPSKTAPPKGTGGFETREANGTIAHVMPPWEQTNSAPVEPVVNITIGRIDVQATRGEGKKQPRQPKKPSGIMGLDQYLQKRTHGGNR